MKVDAKINNTPKDIEGKTGFIVARRDDYTAKLWYYGRYDTEARAYEVAKELDNGIVLELKGE